MEKTLKSIQIHERWDSKLIQAQQLNSQDLSIWTTRWSDWVAQQPSSKKKHVFSDWSLIARTNKKSHKPYLIVIDMIHTVDAVLISLQCN